MKLLDAGRIDEIGGRRINAGETFCFQCAEHLECFNRCCRNLNLFLYPYDVIRLKNGLKISSGEFIEKYTDAVMRKGESFPDVLLTMSDNEEKTCPFLTDAGCGVYRDRPYSCRVFPVEQGAVYDHRTKNRSFVWFFRPPDFCSGSGEKKEWTPDSWIRDQDAVLYTRMTVKWASVKECMAGRPASGGSASPMIKTAFAASYNIDHFREMVFSGSFFKRFKVKAETRRKIKKDDVKLLQLGFEWIKHIWKGGGDTRLEI